MDGSATTRERIERFLRDGPLTAAELAEKAGTTPDSVLDHVRHVARSLSNEEARVEVVPPRCRSCGFDDFDDLANRPSRCPRCRSEAIDDPIFVIRE